ncbi:MAG: hypothetical protein JSV05_08685 [Candidatus Bathyarchaeota archaeon]|nr:MAG: hypothetical protein JSV05_08685 [Candidatus Bathyarchaeota archaeon]
MQKNRKTKQLGKERLQRIIDLCFSVEERGVDPFLINIDDLISVIQQFFPEWKNPEELCLDAEALHQIASAIKLQSDWVKQRSTSLYRDPFLVMEKLQTLTKEDLGLLFLKSWQPIVQLEQISPSSMVEALTYWHNLTPLDERWRKDELLHILARTATREELIEQQIISEKKFSKELEIFWEELKRKVGNKQKIEYWDFIGDETYEETVKRAYLTSFLVTYGYATLEVDRLEEIIYILPFDIPKPTANNKQATSLPIPITFEEWRNWKAGERE